MWTNFLIAMGGVIAVSLIGFVVAWKALEAGRSAAKPDVGQLEQSLDRIEHELKSVREFSRSVR
jgi:hypothetical protein